MKKLKTKENASGIEGGAWLPEYVIVDVAHEVAAHRVLHHEECVLWRLEAAVKLHEERM